MKAVSNLSQLELNNLISEASRELEARKKSEAVVRDIHKVLDKHGITKRERSALLEAAKSGGMPSTRAPKRASKRKGVKVAPKYRCPTSGDTWTGRGRPPAWVVDACASNKLSIKAFKSSSTYLI
jgi:DNA-binding protein H-NS